MTKAKTRIDLSPLEAQLFDIARKGNVLPLAEYLFRTPFSGTYFTPGDRVEQFQLLYSIWRKLGQPEYDFTATIEDQEVKLHVLWDPFYEGEPIFLLKHGFRILDWIKPLIRPQTVRAIAVTGTGSGKTANVAIAALTYCVVYPGFGFLNGGPTQYQSDLMLGEVTKWVQNAPFLKFVRRSRGANPLWKDDPYPTVSIVSPIDPTVTSKFTCQTIAQNANNILGTGQDWINIDEAQLATGLVEAEPKITTRMRGTNERGLPRWTKFTMISNPGDNIDFATMLEKYEGLQEKDSLRFVAMRDVPIDVNIYVTERQKKDMVEGMSDLDRQRWMYGSMAAFADSSTITAAQMWGCHSEDMEEQVKVIGRYSEGFGLMEYELPYEPGRTYVVLGDIGKSPLVSMSSYNGPAIMVFDITDFLEYPHRLVALFWADGKGTYRTWAEKMEYYMFKYRARGFYDAGNIASALEDVGSFKNLPGTVPLYFSGRIGIKKYCLAIVQILIQNGYFNWPHIKGLWHQASIYDPSKGKIADDIMTCLLLLARALIDEGTLWSKFIENFKYVWDAKAEEEESDEGIPGDDWPGDVVGQAYRQVSSRYARVSPGQRRHPAQETAPIHR